jgi:predicted Zn-dependent protease
MKNKVLFIGVVVCGFSLIGLLSCKKGGEGDQLKDVSQDVSSNAVVVQSTETVVSQERGAPVQQQEFVDTRALNKMAGDCMIKKEYEKAYQYIEKSLAISPRDAWTLCLKGQILSEMNKPGAMEAYEQSIRITDQMGPNNGNPYAYSGLARYYFKQGNRAKAIECAKKARDLGPKDKYLDEFYQQLQKGSK